MGTANSGWLQEKKGVTFEPENKYCNF